MEAADFEEAIFHLRTTRRQAQRLNSFENQASELIVPLSAMRDGVSGFLRWMQRVTQSLPIDERTTLYDKLFALEEKWMKTIDEYLFPVVTLSDETSADAVRTIFETLNRTGVKLSAFELLTARFWPKEVNLRDRWRDARELYPTLTEFEIDPYMDTGLRRYDEQKFQRTPHQISVLA